MQRSTLTPPSARRGAGRDAVLATCFLLVGATGCEQSLDPIEPVLVSVLSPYSGDLGAVGAPLEDAARLAAEQVNAAGGVFNGRPLVLEFSDTETSGSMAKTLAARAVEVGAAAVIGPATSGGSLEASAVTRQAGIPQISCCATSPTLTEAQPPDDRWLFRTAPDDTQQALAIAYLMDEGFDNGTESVAACDVSAIIYRNDVYGGEFAPVLQEVFQARGGTMPDNLLFEYDVSGTNDQLPEQADGAVGAFAAELASIPEDDRVCVVVISYSVDGIEIVRRLENLFSDSTRSGTHLIIGTDGTRDADFAAAVQGTNLIGTAPTHASSGESGRAYEDFATAFAARFDTADAPPNFTWNIYDAVIIAAAGMAKSELESGAALRDAIRETSTSGQVFRGGVLVGSIADAVFDGTDIDYVGPSGNLDFDANGDVVGDFLLWRTNGTITVATGFLENSVIRN